MFNEIVVRGGQEGIATLTLNSPDNLNALSEKMIDALQASLDEVARDSAVRCVILKGAGRAFCAGHDLKELTRGREADDGGRSYFRLIFDKCAAMMQSIQRLPQPVIAEVHGVAVAAGCQLVATCDLAVAARNARFGVNGVNIGLFCSTPMVALTRNVSRKHAFEMLTTGTLIDAERAMAMGLLNSVVEEEEVASETSRLAELIASKLGAAVKVGKQAFYEQAQLPLREAYEFTGDVMVENMLFRDTEEGISAFIEKRKPDWQESR